MRFSADSKLSVYIKAARLRTLPLSLSGILLAGMLAAADGYFSLPVLIFSVLTAVSFQILSNFANDYGDGVKGTDRIRTGPERMLQSGALSRRELKRLIYVTAVISAVLSGVLLYGAFGPAYLHYYLIFGILGILSIWAAVKYTVGKSAYGYKGLGDVFVLVFFGLLSVAGGYFLYAKTVPWLVFAPALSVGLLSTGVLHLNNMRDLETDAKSGKITLAVRMGALRSKQYFFYLVGFAFLFAMYYANYQYKSLWQFLFVPAFIPIIRLLIRVIKNEDPARLNPELKKLALSTFVFSVLFGLGQILAA